jgi:predicted small integral membrane protein
MDSKKKARDHMLAVRLAKIVSVGAIALYMALVVFNNVTDYWTNFAYVTAVLDIEQISPRSDIRWRAVTSPLFHHAAFVLIIVTEFAIAVLTGAGALAMARALKAPAQKFARSKAEAVVGLALGFLLYEGGFVAVAGEWFGMWQSAAADAVPSAFRILSTMLGILIFVSLKDEELA